MANIITTEELVVRDDELHIRQISAEVAEIFDDVLAEADIMVPDSDREGEEDEAALYGGTYSDFEDEITGILAGLVNDSRTTGADTAKACESIYELFTALMERHGFTVPGDKDAIFESMNGNITELLEIAAKYPTYPVNEWEY